MALQSTLFRGDAKLDAALVSDPAHIVQGSRGPHVTKIQQALILVDGASIAADGAYGPATASAVSAFKKKRSILNAQGQIDNIVGKKTIAALDRELIEKEPRRLANVKPGVFRVPGNPQVVILPKFSPNQAVKSGINSNDGEGARRFGVDNQSTPSLQSLHPLRVVAFNEPPNSFILSQSVDLPGGPRGDKNDLDTGNPPTPRLTGTEDKVIQGARLLITSEALRRGTTEVKLMEEQAMFESRFGAGPNGVVLMEAFFRNTDRTFSKTFGPGTSFSREVEASKGFAIEFAGVVNDITKALQAQFLTGTIDYRLMRGVQTTIPGKPHARLANPNGVKGIVEVGYDRSEPRMVALVGSFQAATLFLTGLSVDKVENTFEVSLRFELIDHFGVDNSDVVFDFKGHGFPGQIAFWLLQHTARPNHVPFPFTVIVEKQFSGTLLDPDIFPDLTDLELLRQLMNVPE